MYNHLDNKNQPALNTRKAIKKFIEREIERYRIETKQDYKYCRLALEFEKPMEERRIKAVLNSIDKIKNEHQMCIDDWVMTNIQSNSYNMYDQITHFLLAASIWILDCLSDVDVPFDELYKLLPRDSETIKPLMRNNLSVCGYSPELTASVEYVLRNRNNDIPSTPSCYNDTKRILTNNFNALGMVDHNVPSRQNFEKLMALIPQGKIDSAVNKFRECYNEWCKRYFYGIKYFVDSLNEVVDELNQKQKKNNVTLDKKRKPFNNKYKVYNSYLDMLKVLDNNVSEFIDINARTIKLNVQLQAFRDCMLFGMGFTEEFCNKALDGKFVELIEPMPSADPYELCFALLYLIEQDDDIPWLYGSCIGMLRGYLRELPWCTTNNNSNINYKSIPTWYELPYRYQNDKSDSEFNLSQVIFSATGTVMPRRIKSTDETLKVFNTYNIDANTSLDVLYMLNSLRETKECIPALNLDKEYMSALCGENSDSSQVDSSELQRKIAELEQEVKQLHSQLHDADKKISDIESEYKTFKEEVKNEQRELYELREIIFKDTADEQYETIVDDKKYPYDVQNNTVIFGGFDTQAQNPALIQGCLP